MSKRAQGEGSIFQRTDGRWCASITVGVVNGRQKRKDIYGKTQKEVLEKLAANRHLQKQGINIAPERHTVSTWLTRWLDEQRPPTVRYGTYTSYENHVRCHLIPAVGNYALAKLQPSDVRDLMRAKAKEGLSSKTIRHIRATLRTALNGAMRDGLILRNVAALAKPPRLEKPEMLVLDRADAAKFIEAVRGHRLETLFTTALCLGLRQGEILGLRWNDIDFEGAKLHVRNALQRTKGEGESKSELRLARPKTENSRRAIALPQVALTSLSAHKRRQDEERELCGTDWQEGGFVFTSLRGTAIDPRNLLRDFYAILACVDIPKIRFHDLRHSAATLLLAQGVHARFIMELLGHSTINLTMNTYSHVLEEMKRETANQMDAIFNPVAVNVAVRQSRKRPN